MKKQRLGEVRYSTLRVQIDKLIKGEKFNVIMMQSDIN